MIYLKPLYSCLNDTADGTCEIFKVGKYRIIAFQNIENEKYLISDLMKWHHCKPKKQ